MSHPNPMYDPENSHDRDSSEKGFKFKKAKGHALDAMLNKDYPSSKSRKAIFGKGKLREEKKSKGYQAKHF